MNELDKTIDDCLKKANEYDKLAVSYREIQDNYVRILGTQYKPDYSESEECVVSASWNRQLAEWLKELKAYREADEEICRKMESGQWSEAVVYGMSKALVIMRNHIREVNAESDKGVLEKINEKQDSLKATCKAWDEAISRDGYVD